MQEQLLTVEVHDVSPATREEAGLIVEELDAAGVSTPSILVIPNHEDEGGYRWDLREHPATADWLRSLESNGCEIIQHGYTHRASEKPPPGLANAFMYHCFSAGCAEFAHLSRKEATRRLVAGKRILHECGLETRGFIAPAWQQSVEAIAALAGSGYSFTAFYNFVLPLIGEHLAIRSPALTFDAPCALIDYGKRAAMRFIEYYWCRSPLLRVALHPADARGSRPLRHVIRRIKELTGRRRVTSYSRWLS